MASPARMTTLPHEPAASAAPQVLVGLRKGQARPIFYSPDEGSGLAHLEASFCRGEHSTWSTVIPEGVQGVLLSVTKPQGAGDRLVVDVTSPLRRPERTTYTIRSDFPASICKPTHSAWLSRYLEGQLATIALKALPVLLLLGPDAVDGAAHDDPELVEWASTIALWHGIGVGLLVEKLGVHVPVVGPSFDGVPYVEGQDEPEGSVTLGAPEDNVPLPDPRAWPWSALHASLEDDAS